MRRSAALLCDWRADHAVRRKLRSAQLDLNKLGDEGARDIIRRAEVARDKRRMASGMTLPLVKDSGGLSAQQQHARGHARPRGDSADTMPSLPEGCVALYADCTPETTTLTFIANDSLIPSNAAYKPPRIAPSDAYTRDERASEAAGRDVFARVGSEQPDLLGHSEPVRPKRLRGDDARDPFFLELPQKANDGFLLTYSPSHAGYQPAGCMGYAAAQVATNEALYKVYQTCLDRKLVLPRKQLDLVLYIRGYQRGRGGVFNALKDNPHLLRLVDVRDCTSADAVYKKHWTLYSAPHK